MLFFWLRGHRRCWRDPAWAGHGAGFDPGFDPDRPDLPFREAKLDVRRAISVVLSPDGTKIRYRTGSLHPLHGEPVYKAHEYDVFAGTLNDD